MTIETILIFTYVLLGLDVIILLMIFGNKTWQRRKALLQTRAENFFIAHYVRNENITRSCHPKAIMKAYQKFYDQTVLSDETKRLIYQDFLDCGLVKKNIKKLNCLSVIGRKTAASNLSFFQSPEVQ